jgi:hypothetical protein
MVKNANNKKLVTLTPIPKAIKFPELSEKGHIQCHTFLEDQVLLLGVRPFWSLIALGLPNISIFHVLECFHTSGMSNLCRIY